MNYLSHFVFNHEVCGHPVVPHFVLGVAIPDLWPRVSRRRRIHWPSVRASSPTHASGQALRAGLLNHVAADAAFHQSGSFLDWQAELAAAQPRARHHAVRDFLAHVTLELALDHHLVHADPGLADRFYGVLAEADPSAAERHLADVGRVDARGLATHVGLFQERGFLRAYGERLALRAAMRFVLGMVRVELEPLPDDALDRVVDGAIALARPDAVWSDLRRSAAARRIE